MRRTGYASARNLGAAPRQARREAEAQLEIFSAAGVTLAQIPVRNTVPQRRARFCRRWRRGEAKPLYWACSNSPRFSVRVEYFRCFDETESLFRSHKEFAGNPLQSPDELTPRPVEV